MNTTQQTLLKTKLYNLTSILKTLKGDLRLSLLKEIIKIRIKLNWQL